MYKYCILTTILPYISSGMHFISNFGIKTTRIPKWYIVWRRRGEVGWERGPLPNRRSLYVRGPRFVWLNLLSVNLLNMCLPFRSVLFWFARMVFFFKPDLQRCCNVSMGLFHFWSRHAHWAIFQFYRANSTRLVRVTDHHKRSNYSFMLDQPLRGRYWEMNKLINSFNHVTPFTTHTLFALLIACFNKVPWGRNWSTGGSQGGDYL